MKKIFGLMTGIGIIFGSGNLLAATSEYTCPEGSVSTLHCFTCGEHCTMTLDTATGHAVVSGTGDMEGKKASTTLGGNAWNIYNSYFKDVEIEKGITSIGYSAFKGSSVVSVIIPNTVTKIEASAFNTATKLANLVIPDSVKIIEDWVFDRTSSLKELVIPDSVEVLGYGAFYSSGIQNLTIPDSLVLEDIRPSDEQKPSDSHTFGSSGSLKTVYCSGGGDTTKCDAILKQGGKNIHSISKPSPKKVGKRIYTVEEATQAVSGKGRKKFIIRYR